MIQPHFNALYHPSYVPPANWLKLQLLFWDSVQRIVPDPMIEKYGDDFIDKKYHISPDLCPCVNPTTSDYSYFNIHKNAILKAFESIRKSIVPSVDISTFSVHSTKAPPWIFESLTQLGLVFPASEETNQYLGDHYWVYPDAAKLILSCLSSNIAARRNLHPITEQESCFYLTAANEINNTLADRPNSSVQAALGILILQVQIPSNLNQLDFSDVIKLRGEYEEFRIAFHNTVISLTDHFNLNKIVDEKVYKEELRSCMESYVAQMNHFNSLKQKIKRLVSDWKTEAFAVSLGGLGKYVAGGSPESLYISIASASLGLAKVILSGKEISEVVKSYHYIQVLNKFLDVKCCVTGIRPFLVGVRYE
jgi:hypothetical protein